MVPTATLKFAYRGGMEARTASFENHNAHAPERESVQPYSEQVATMRHLFEDQRLLARSAIVGVSILGILGAFAATPANASPSAPGTAVIQTVASPLLSTVIPVQPLADPTTGRPLVTSGRVSPAPMNEPVWTRTCDRGYGTEIWNNIAGENCAGTLTFYYDNVSKSSFNELRRSLDYPNRTGHLYSALNAWCGSHSLYCNAISYIAGLGSTAIWGMLD